MGQSRQDEGCQWGLWSHTHLHCPECWPRGAMSNAAHPLVMGNRLRWHFCLWEQMKELKEGKRRRQV